MLGCCPNNREGNEQTAVIETAERNNWRRVLSIGTLLERIMEVAQEPRPPIVAQRESRGKQNKYPVISNYSRATGIESTRGD